jgi:hypothetical protein
LRIRESRIEQRVEDLGQSFDLRAFYQSFPYVYG